MSLIRLLQRKPDGEIVFREPTSGEVPAYAILSHTWGEEEVIYQELKNGDNKSKTVNKAGWRKIQFCAIQAAADGLEYFWVDTCCIDKKNAVELAAAINSMFRWYQEAARCYVYLSDISIQDERQQCSPSWESAFRKSRWFTRGWTLQELIAPKSVVFFSADGERLGNKLILEQMIYEITGIATNALRGKALPDFSIDERMSWAERRNTTVDEDKAYCLLGIFDVSMSLIYGEGREKALRRLRQKIHKSYKGTDLDQFTVRLDISTTPEAAQFVARELELSEMHKLLYGHSARSAVVLHGLGGMGKTQLAIEYIRKHKEKYTAIFWLNANDEGSLKLSFRDIAQQVLRHHPSASLLASVDLEGDLDQVVKAVKAWLSVPKNTRWLMIFDNLDNPKVPNNNNLLAVDVRPFLPGPDHGSIIITTRSSRVSQGQRIQVQKLSNTQEALKILSNTSGREGIENDTAAVELVKELDGLPLALSTAGAYLEHVTMGFSDYLRLYKASWLQIQTTSPQLSSYENRSLYTTWQITYDRVQQQNIASARLLKLWAYFDKQDLWFGLLRHAKSANDEWIQKLVEDELKFTEAVSLLGSFGLVDTDRPLRQQFGPRGYSVHSCVHSWTVSVLNKEWDESLAGLALFCVASEVPSTHEENWWLLHRRLLQHAMRQNLFIVDDKVDMDIDGRHWALGNLGDLYTNLGNLAEAENMYIRALQGYEKSLGPDHISTHYSVYRLAILRNNQGKLAESEKMYIRALKGYEDVLGPDHKVIFNTVNNLGSLYANQGKLSEAEKMYNRALKGYEVALGPDDISTLLIVNNLGNLYRTQGNLAKAEKMYTRALKGYKEALGRDHTVTFDTISNLGSLYANQGKLSEAEKMYNRALNGRKEALGADHISTLDSIHCLAVLYSRQGNLAKSEKMYVQALTGHEEALGPDHISTLLTVNNLGNLYVSQGKLAEAEKMYTRALKGYKEALGADHISTLNSIHCLAILYSRQGNLAKSEKMYIQALTGHKEALGPDHISTLLIVNNLGNFYRIQDKLAEAEWMYTRALKGFEEALGYEPMSSYIPALSTMFALGYLFSQTNRKDMAKVMYNRALSGFATAQGPSSKWCTEIKRRLQALQPVPIESEACEERMTETGAQGSRPLKRKLSASKGG